MDIVNYSRIALFMQDFLPCKNIVFSIFCEIWIQKINTISLKNFFLKFWYH